MSNTGNRSLDTNVMNCYQIEHSVWILIWTHQNSVSFNIKKKKDPSETKDYNSMWKEMETTVDDFNKFLFLPF